LDDILYDKYYYECYALLTLKYFWSGYKEGYENLDKPDLQNEDANVGIEVVQALSEDEGMYRSRIIKYFGNENYEEYIQDEIDRNNNSKSIYAIRDGHVYDCQDELAYDYKVHSKQILEKIQIKHEKLNRQEDEYKLFSTNGLYVYAENQMITINDITKLRPQIKQIAKRFVKKFNIVFINAVDKMYIIDGENEIQQMDFDAESLKKMHSEALIRSEIIRITN